MAASTCACCSAVTWATWSATASLTNASCWASSCAFCCSVFAASVARKPAMPNIAVELRAVTAWRVTKAVGLLVIVVFVVVVIFFFFFVVVIIVVVIVII